MGHSLEKFYLGTLMSLVGHLAIETVGTGLPMPVSVNLERFGFGAQAGSPWKSLRKPAWRRLRCQ